MKFDHEKRDVIEAIGYKDAKEIEAITNSDEEHPDKAKLILLTYILNGDTRSTLSLMVSLFTGKPLSSTASVNLETLFEAFDEDKYKQFVKQVNETVKEETDPLCVFLDELMSQLEDYSREG